MRTSSSAAGGSSVLALPGVGAAVAALPVVPTWWAPGPAGPGATTRRQSLGRGRDEHRRHGDRDQYAHVRFPDAEPRHVDPPPASPSCPRWRPPIPLSAVDSQRRPAAGQDGDRLSVRAACCGDGEWSSATAPRHAGCNIPSPRNNPRGTRRRSRPLGPGRWPGPGRPPGAWSARWRGGCGRSWGRAPGAGRSWRCRSRGRRGRGPRARGRSGRGTAGPRRRRPRTPAR